MRFGKEVSPKHGLQQIRMGVKEFEECLDEKEHKLSELFVSLKDDILSSQRLTSDHIHVLKKQVRHILSVARAIGYHELERAFEQEEEVLSQLGDLLERYPDMDVSASADVQSALENLRSMIRSQQQMIFLHEEIMSHEKQRLVQILQEASALEQEYEREQQVALSKQSGILH